MHKEPTTALGRLMDHIEETSIAVCLGLMTLITFANVVARYAFESNILWALEITVFLFAWLVLMGMSYGVKKHVHIGVDVVINALPPGMKRLSAILSAIACVAFSILLLIGAVIGAQIGTIVGAKLRGEQLRGLLALMVLAVCGKIVFDLLVTPDELFVIAGGGH